MSVVCQTAPAGQKGSTAQYLWESGWGVCSAQLLLTPEIHRENKKPWKLQSKHKIRLLLEFASNFFLPSPCLVLTASPVDAVFLSPVIIIFPRAPGFQKCLIKHHIYSSHTSQTPQLFLTVSTSFALSVFFHNINLSSNFLHNVKICHFFKKNHNRIYDH